MIYFLLFFEFFKIGLFTFGGGFAMIPLIEETVIKYSWLSEQQFYSFLGVCESTPGPIAINMATYIGSVNGGLLGSVLATVGVVLPSFIIILLISALLKNFNENRFVKGFLSGVKPVVIALIFSTGLILFAKAIGYVSLKSFNFDIISTIIFAVAAITFYGAKHFLKKKLSAIAIILISAVLGIALCLVKENFIIV